MAHIRGLLIGMQYILVDASIIIHQKTLTMDMALHHGKNRVLGLMPRTVTLYMAIVLPFNLNPHESSILSNSNLTFKAKSIIMERRRYFGNL